MSTSARTIDWEAELPLHREWMVRVALDRLDDPHAAEDVVQDIILSVVRQDPSLEDNANLRGWLYQAVVRRVADHFRRQYRQQCSSGEPWTDADEPVGDDVDWILRTEKRHLLTTAMNQLPPTDREILLLKYVRNWTYKQISQRYDLGERAVEYRLTCAKRLLRNELRRIDGSEYE